MLLGAALLGPSLPDSSLGGLSPRGLSPPGLSFPAPFTCPLQTGTETFWDVCPPPPDPPAAPPSPAWPLGVLGTLGGGAGGCLVLFQRRPRGPCPRGVSPRTQLFVVGARWLVWGHSGVSKGLVWGQRRGCRGHKEGHWGPSGGTGGSSGGHRGLRGSLWGFEGPKGSLWAALGCIRRALRPLGMSGGRSGARLCSEPAWGPPRVSGGHQVMGGGSLQGAPGVLGGP